MKNFIKIAFCSLLMLSCYNDETIIIDENSDELLHGTSYLTLLMRDVMANDTTKDFTITNSNCFTFNLPYSLKIDGEIRTITQLSDIEDITEDHQIEYVFPLEVSFVNYTSLVVNFIEEFNELQQKCIDDNLDYHKNTCATFIYPIELEIYDTNRQRFRTEKITHDFEGFDFIRKLRVEELYSITYPTEIITQQENQFSITTNDLLETHFKISFNTCN